MKKADTLAFPVLRDRLPPPPPGSLDDYHRFVLLQAAARDAAGTNFVLRDRPQRGPRFRLHDGDENT